MSPFPGFPEILLIKIHFCDSVWRCPPKSLKSLPPKAQRISEFKSLRLPWSSWPMTGSYGNMKAQHLCLTLRQTLKSNLCSRSPLWGQTEARALPETAPLFGFMPFPALLPRSGIKGSSIP